MSYNKELGELAKLRQARKEAKEAKDVKEEGNEQSNNEQNTDEAKDVIKINIDADNSCLFNAIGYLTEKKSSNMAVTYRMICGSIIQSNPKKYTKAYLNNKTIAEYVEYITNPLRWGGGIEIEILANYYNIQIAVGYIESGAFYFIGPKENNKRIYLCYSGLHYDALVTSNNLSGMFTIDDSATLDKMTKWLQEEKVKGNYTNTKDFHLLCSICNEAMQGTTMAKQHAQFTKHTQFEEYKIDRFFTPE
jgi:ubiquitin thioesterase OTU1